MPGCRCQHTSGRYRDAGRDGRECKERKCRSGRWMKCLLRFCHLYFAAAGVRVDQSAKCMRITVIDCVPVVVPRRRTHCQTATRSTFRPLLSHLPNLEAGIVGPYEELRHRIACSINCDATCTCAAGGTAMPHSGGQLRTSGRLQRLSYKVRAECAVSAASSA